MYVQLICESLFNLYNYIIGLFSNNSSFINFALLRFFISQLLWISSAPSYTCEVSTARTLLLKLLHEEYSYLIL